LRVPKSAILAVGGFLNTCMQNQDSLVAELWQTIVVKTRKVQKRSKSKYELERKTASLRNDLKYQLTLFYIIYLIIKALIYAKI
jgi:hypothetical protein